MEQRLKCPYGEMDLLFQKQNKIALIEVKFLHDEWMVFERVAVKQVKRLTQNLLFFQNQLQNFSVKLFIALVNADGQIKWISLNS